MNRTVSVERAKNRPGALSSEKLIKWSCIVSASAFTLIGLVMLVAAFTTTGIIFKAIETFLSSGMLAAAILLWRTVLRKEYQSRGVGLLAGEIALACAFVYLGVAMPVFHQGLASAHTASIQFVAVLATLVVGSAALALSGFSKPSRPLGQVTFPSMVRDGVILLTGTVLLAIALGQLSGAAIKPPHWNWISFLGITIPGMLLLVAREGLKEYFETRSGSGSFLCLLLTDTLLVLGLTIMFYGSYTNLTLGINGYQVGLKGNAAGLSLWIIAALVLLLVRGVFKVRFSHRDNRMSYRVMSKLLYILAVVPLIYGERAIITGNSPLFAAGAAAPTVALFLLGGFLVLVIARSANQKVLPG